MCFKASVASSSGFDAPLAQHGTAPCIANAWNFTSHGDPCNWKKSIHSDCGINFHLIISIPYHPCMVYLPTFTCNYHKHQPNVGKYTVRPMDPMGMYPTIQSSKVFFFGFHDLPAVAGSGSSRPQDVHHPVPSAVFVTPKVE